MTLKLIKIAIFISLLSLTLAGTFSCNNLKPLECKNVFGKHFSAEFKKIHLSAMRYIFTKFIDHFRAVITRLPNDDSDYFKLNETVVHLENFLGEMKVYEDDKPIIEIFEQIMNDTNWLPNNDLFIQKLNNFTDFRDMNGIIAGVLHDIFIDFGKLYMDMYVGLSSQDLEIYPEYDRLKEIMNKLQDEDYEDAYKIQDYAMANEILSKEFDLPYFSKLKPF